MLVKAHDRVSHVPSASRARLHVLKSEFSLLPNAYPRIHIILNVCFRPIITFLHPIFHPPYTLSQPHMPLRPQIIAVQELPIHRSEQKVHYVWQLAVPVGKWRPAPSAEAPPDAFAALVEADCSLPLLWLLASTRACVILRRWTGKDVSAFLPLCHLLRWLSSLAGGIAAIEGRWGTERGGHGVDMDCDPSGQNRANGDPAVIAVICECVG